jgi:hypothetical protein
MRYNSVYNEPKFSYHYFVAGDDKKVEFSILGDTVLHMWGTLMKGTQAVEHKLYKKNRRAC